jgi:haloalkane dehalogenase
MEAFLGPLAWDRFPGPKKEIFQNFRTPELCWDIIVNQNIFVEKIPPGSVVRRLTEGRRS